MTDLKARVYVEIDIVYCLNTYGSAPCTASGSGDAKCFNTRNRTADCQDPANFTAGTKTLRFGLRDRPLDPGIHCIPLLADASVTNARVMPGVSIGERSRLRATFWNSPHGDAGLDKYIVDRTYNPFNQGTFWGKFRARNTYLEARPIRIYQGYEGQTLAEMDCQHFVIDLMEGPDASGSVTITGSDFMKLLNSEKSQAPEPNTGYLTADLAAGASAFTLIPVGVGDAEYPASGQVVLGKELLTYSSRTGDVFTLSGVTAEDHDEGDNAQLPLVYTSQDAADIINDLITTYTPLDSSYTDLTAWQEIVTDFSDVLYSRVIPKPTPVVDLVNELIEQAGLVIFGNPRTQQIEFDVLRPNPATGLALRPDEILLNSFRQIDQPSKRYSQVWVFYGKRDVFEDDTPTNYYSAVINVAEDNQYETASIKKIFSKWIPSSARSVAEDVAQRAIARYKFPPRRLAWELAALNTRQLGQVVTLTDPAIETATGAQGTLQGIITGWVPNTDKHSYEAEEYNIDADTFVGDRVLQIDFDTYNINLRAIYDALYATIDASGSGPDIIFKITGGVRVGSTSTSVHAVETGTWPAGVVPTLILEPGVFLVGRGGNGSYGTGGDGGPALLVTSPINLDNNATIGGGGGGGGGMTSGVEGYAEAGGGAGALGGLGYNNGTVSSGGLGEAGIGPEYAGDGGGLGVDGSPATIYPSGGDSFPGGSAGNAIDGVSMVTFITTGTILGAQVG